MPAQTLQAPSTARNVRTWTREQKLRRFGHPTYADYISSGDWHRLKVRYRNSDLPQDCHLCHATDRVELHHRTYERVCEEELTDIIPLCSGCHSLAHALERRGDIPNLDTDGLSALVDQERAGRNARQQTQLRRQQIAEFNGPKEEERVLARSRTIRQEINRVMKRAAALGTDTAPALRIPERGVEMLDDANAAKSRQR